jgi:hypothetical protein
MKHVEALDQAIEESRIDHARGYAPLIELCRTLAGQMDEAGKDPSTRLTAAYLSALKDFRRAVVQLPSIRREPSKLDLIRAERRVPRPSIKTRERG